MADEDVCTDDEDVTFETYVDEGSDTLVDEFEDPAVTELDTVGGVVESVQFSTSSTLSSIGIRVMIQVFVTAPIGLGIFFLVMMTSIQRKLDIRIVGLNTGDSGLRGLDNGGL